MIPRRVIAIQFWLVVLLNTHMCAVTASEVSSPKKPLLRIQPEHLPAVVVGYGLFAMRYEELKALEANPQNVLTKLSEGFDGFKVDLSARLAFSHRSFIVQNRISGHISGFVRGRGKTLAESGVPVENCLFVTTPIDSFNKRTLVVISSVGPDRTTIVSVDSELGVHLHYDSFDQNRADKLTLGSVYGVRVVSDGRFLIEGRNEPGGRGLLSAYKNRAFVVDVTNGVFKLSSSP